MRRSSRPRRNASRIGLDILGRQCLDQRIGDTDQLKREVAAWEAERNANEAKVDRQFTTDKARIRLKRLYPSLEE